MRYTQLLFEIELLKNLMRRDWRLPVIARTEIASQSPFGKSTAALTFPAGNGTACCVGGCKTIQARTCILLSESASPMSH